MFPLPFRTAHDRGMGFVGQEVWVGSQAMSPSCSVISEVVHLLLPIFPALMISAHPRKFCPRWWGLMKTNGLAFISFNIENFLKTYNVPGTILGGEDPIVIETQSLLSRRKEQSMMAVDTVCYVAVRAEAWRTAVREPRGSLQEEIHRQKKEQLSAVPQDFGVASEWWDVILTQAVTAANWLSITLAGERTAGSFETCCKATARPGATWWIAEAGEDRGGWQDRGGGGDGLCWREYLGLSTSIRVSHSQQPEFSFPRPCSSTEEILAVKP